MNRNLVIPAAILLIAGAVAVAILNQDDAKDPATKEANGTNERSSGSRPTSSGGGSSDRSVRTSPDRTPGKSRQRELVEEYGRERATKAREVSTNVVSILEDVVAIGEMMMKGGQQFGGRRGMVGGMARRIGIELNEEQQEKALALYDEWQQGQLEKSKTALSTLKDDPTAMMSLFLAGDAKEKGEISDDDYALVREEAAGELVDVINPLDRNNFRGDRMSGDEALMDRFAEILDPDQQEQFSTYREQQAAENEEKPARDGNITAMPTMELDTLGEAVTGAQKMTSGFRTVIEGMGSLEQLRPQIDPEAGGN